MDCPGLRAGEVPWHVSYTIFSSLGRPRVVSVTCHTQNFDYSGPQCPGASKVGVVLGPMLVHSPLK